MPLYVEKSWCYQAACAAAGGAYVLHAIAVIVPGAIAQLEEPAKAEGYQCTGTPSPDHSLTMYPYRVLAPGSAVEASAVAVVASVILAAPDLMEDSQEVAGADTGTSAADRQEDAVPPDYLAHIASPDRAAVVALAPAVAQEVAVLRFPLYLPMYDRLIVDAFEACFLLVLSG